MFSQSKFYNGLNTEEAAVLAFLANMKRDAQEYSSLTSNTNNFQTNSSFFVNELDELEISHSELLKMAYEKRLVHFSQKNCKLHHLVLNAALIANLHAKENKKTCKTLKRPRTNECTESSGVSSDINVQLENKESTAKKTKVDNNDNFGIEGLEEWFSNDEDFEKTTLDVMESLGGMQNSDFNNYHINNNQEEQSGTLEEQCSSWEQVEERLNSSSNHFEIPSDNLANIPM